MKNVLLIMLGFVLFGCATGYHPVGFSGSYYETYTAREASSFCRWSQK